jgi:ATP-dependent protease ClpP protease subunit
MADHTILFSSDIDVPKANEFIQLLAQLQHQGATRVQLAINSGGGHVQSGILLYNVLRSMPFEIVTHNVGNVDSIANVIFLSGAQRYACPAATFMFHGVGFNAAANQRFEEAGLEAMLDTVIADQRRMSDIIADRTGLSSPACMELFKAQKTRDAGLGKGEGVGPRRAGLCLSLQLGKRAKSVHQVMTCAPATPGS